MLFNKLMQIEKILQAILQNIGGNLTPCLMIWGNASHLIQLSNSIVIAKAYINKIVTMGRDG